VAALRRYAREAPSVIQRRYQRAANLQRDERMLEAAELLGTTQTRVLGPCQTVSRTLETAQGVFHGKVDDTSSNVRAGLNHENSWF